MKVSLISHVHRNTLYVYNIKLTKPPPSPPPTNFGYRVPLGRWPLQKKPAGFMHAQRLNIINIFINENYLIFLFVLLIWFLWKTSQLKTKIVIFLLDCFLSRYSIRGPTVLAGRMSRVYTLFVLWYTLSPTLFLYNYLINTQITPCSTNYLCK